MDTTFNAPGPDRRGLRDTFLSDSLLTSLRELMPRYINTLDVVPQQDDRGPIDDMLRQTAMRPGRWAQRRLFVGLNGNAADHQGHNLLVCTRPLKTELSDFAARHGLSDDRSGRWVAQVLGSFEKILFLDRFHFGESASFAPWVQPNLIDRFPLRLADYRKDDTTSNQPHILILDHRTRAGEKDRLPDYYDRLKHIAHVTYLTGAEPSDEIRSALSADIHIHHCFSNHRPAELSPIDSMAAGFYTIILPEKGKNGTLLGDETMGFAAARSYADVAENRRDVLSCARQMVQRADTIRKSGLPFNPEIRRAKRMNDEFLAQRINMLRSYVLQ